MIKLLTLILIFVSSPLFGCSGDCLKCHPTLEKSIYTDERHSPMLECINCHKDNQNSMGSCGSDCFQCHETEKIISVPIKEHQEITKCIKCHSQIKNKNESQILKQPIQSNRIGQSLKEDNLNLESYLQK